MNKLEKKYREEINRSLQKKDKETVSFLSKLFTKAVNKEVYSIEFELMFELFTNGIPVSIWGYSLPDKPGDPLLEVIATTFPDYSGEFTHIDIQKYLESGKFEINEVDADIIIKWLVRIMTKHKKEIFSKEALKIRTTIVEHDSGEERMIFDWD